IALMVGRQDKGTPSPNVEVTASAPSAAPAVTASPKPAARPPVRAATTVRQPRRTLQSMPVLVVGGLDAVRAPVYSPSFGVSGRSMFFHAGRTGTTSLMQATLAADGSIAAVST